MHIYVKQEFASFQNSYFGYTDAKEQKYEIKDSSFLPWHKIEIKTDKYIEATIKQKYFGLKPNYMVFDHDERTGYDCAKYVVDYCLQHNCDIPAYAIQSSNPVGKDNICHLMDNYHNYYKKFHA